MTAEGRTGSILVPGAQFYANQEKIHHWGTIHHIVDDVNQTKPNKNGRQRRSLDDGLGDWKEEGEPAELVYPAPELVKPAPENSKPTESIFDRFVINKTTDKVRQKQAFR